MKPVLVLSGAHADVVATLGADPVMGASNPVRSRTTPGGAGMNIARSLKRLGSDVRLVSAVGDDAHGAMIRDVIEQEGLGPAPDIIHGLSTGSYTAVMQADGEQLIGLADLSIHEAVDGEWISRHAQSHMAESERWVINTNLSPGLLRTVLEGRIEGTGEAAGKQVHAVTISPAKAVRLVPVMDRIDVLHANLKEASALARTAGLTGTDEPAAVVCKAFSDAARAGKAPARGTITHGGEPVFWWDGADHGYLAFDPPERIRDVTGAGDAFAAAMVHGLHAGKDFQDCLLLALGASRLTIETDGPVCPDLTTNRLASAARTMNIRATGS